MDQNIERSQALPNLPEKYELVITDPDFTGVRLFKLIDRETGIKIHFVEFNKDFDIHAAIAFAGARTSRSGKPFEEIFAQIHKASKEGKYTAGAKLSDIYNGEFQGYGHASVADMAPLMIRIEGIPMFEGLVFFNSMSKGGGQELSTRYVDFNDFKITPLDQLVDSGIFFDEEYEKLDEMWNELQDYASEKYQKWTEIIKERLREFLTIDGVPPKESTLTARTLDIARMFLPVGSETVVTMQASVRDIIDLIQQFREDESYHSTAVADQLYTLLNLKGYQEGESLQANLGGLTKYSEGRFTIGKNLDALDEYLQTLAIPGAVRLEEFVLTGMEARGHETKVSKLTFENLGNTEGLFLAMQYILALYPNLSEDLVLEYLYHLPSNVKEEIGRIILQDHHHHNLMRNMGDIRGALYVIESAMAYIRDLNRHRSMGRFIPLLENRDFKNVLPTGYNQNYQINEMEVLKDLGEAWNEDFGGYYKRLQEMYEFLEGCDGDIDTSFMTNLLPLGHQTKLHFSGPTIQLIYMLNLRIAEGGDFGYRNIMQQMLEYFREDPFLVSALETVEMPDANSKAQNLSRR